MNLQIKTVYHWSPSENRKSIMQDGLQIASPSSHEPNGYFSYICLSTTSSGAWNLLPVDPVEYGKDKWDLWEVKLSETDHVNIRGDHVPNINELRVNNTIPPDRVWWVAERNISKEVN